MIGASENIEQQEILTTLETGVTEVSALNDMDKWLVALLLPLMAILEFRKRKKAS